MTVAAAVLAERTTVDATTVAAAMIEKSDCNKVEKDVREMSALLERVDITEVLEPHVNSLRFVFSRAWWWSIRLWSSCKLSDEIAQRKCLQMVNDIKKLLVQRSPK